MYVLNLSNSKILLLILPQTINQCFIVCDITDSYLLKQTDSSKVTFVCHNFQWQTFVSQHLNYSKDIKI